MKKDELDNKSYPLVYLFLFIIMLLGGFVRLIQVIHLDFPLNDGGAFYQMMRDLQASGYTLPRFTNYNQAGIPFAYPPLAFYIGAIAADLFKINLLDILRLLPAIISILTIPAFYFFASRIFSDPIRVLFATFAFTFLPTSFDWLVVGGGLSRSFGFLFAILYLGQVYSLLTQGGRKPIIWATVFASLTVLSHPGTAFFACYGTLVFLIFQVKKSDKGLQKMLLVGLMTILLTSPWWLTVAQTHGFQVLFYPFQTENRSIASLLTPFTFLFTNEPLLDILAFFGLIGVFINLRKRGFFLPVWLLLIFLFDPRLGATYAVLPMSLLVSVGIVEGMIPIFNHHNEQVSKSRINWIPRIALVYLTIYVILNAYIGVNYLTVTREQRETMDWIAEKTPKDSKFLVLTGNPEYGIDPVSEWFPTLSSRQSLTTPQLHEWLPNQEFSNRVLLHAELQACASWDLECVETWSRLNSIQFTHIYIPNPVLIPSVDINKYQILYEHPGGIVLVRKEIKEGFIYHEKYFQN